MRLVDTNVLLYTVSNNAADDHKKEMAATILKEPDLALSVQVLQEFYYQSTRPSGPAGLNHEQAIEFLGQFGSLRVQEITLDGFVCFRLIPKFPMLSQNEFGGETRNVR